VSRFNSEEWLVPEGTPRVPTSAADLLSDLGLAKAPRVIQRAGVRRWMKRNEPHEVLRASLRRAELIG
jgi:hypothetical protein